MPAGPSLRHDFVGMMYAGALSEVGLQAAALVKVGHPGHFLPGYSHLLLATVVIATSFVGWSVSLEWAQDGMPKVFQPEFLVLLLDVSLVIIYIILVRSVEFVVEGRPPSIAPAKRLAFWIELIFVLYLMWDVVMGFAYRKSISCRVWFGEFVVPTVVCFGLSLLAKCLVKGADCSHLITADFALLSLVLLFRALKDLGAALSRNQAPRIKRRAAVASLVCSVLLLVGLLLTACPLQLPSRMVTAIEYPSPPCIDPDG